MNHSPLFTVIWFHSLAVFLPAAILILYRQPKLWQYLFSSFLGILVALIDLSSTEVQLTVLLLLVLGLFLGFNNPASGWKWAILLGVWVPLCSFIKILLLDTPDRIVIKEFGSLLSLCFAFAGVYSGVVVQNLTTKKKYSQTVKS